MHTQKRESVYVCCSRWIFVTEVNEHTQTHNMHAYNKKKPNNPKLTVAWICDAASMYIWPMYLCIISNALSLNIFLFQYYYVHIYKFVCIFRALQAYKMVVWTDTRTNNFLHKWKHRRLKNDWVFEQTCLASWTYKKVVVSKHEHLVLMCKLILMHSIPFRPTKRLETPSMLCINVCLRIIQSLSMLSIYNNRQTKWKKKKNEPIFRLLSLHQHDVALTENAHDKSYLLFSQFLCALCVI